MPKLNNGLERRVVEAYAAVANPGVAGRLAGYRSPDAQASKKLREPRVIEAIREERFAQLARRQGMAWSVIDDSLSRDMTLTSPKLRLEAAKYVIDQMKAEIAPDSAERDPATMDAEQIAAHHAAASARVQRLEELAARLAVDVTPEGDATSSDVFG